MSININHSEKLMGRAKKVMPGGVNSPVRSYNNVHMCPRFIRRADGAYVFDEDGNRYIDYICSWGPMILGHNNPEVREAVSRASENGLSFGAATRIEVEMAEFICSKIPFVEMIRMVNSGTEAVMSAVRLARGWTGRNKIIKFAGNYHGHSDCMLVDAGSGLMTAGMPGSAGVPSGCTQDTLTAIYNDTDSLRRLFEANRSQIAAVIVEPVAANMGVVLPRGGERGVPGSEENSRNIGFSITQLEQEKPSVENWSGERDFLHDIRRITREEGALLIFDEVITGFRLAFGGAAEYYGITPDLVTYGKIIGAGMSVGAYGGRKDIMSLVSPLGDVYQAGTLSGNPVAMSAGLTQLKILNSHPDYYAELAEKGKKLFGGIEELINSYEARMSVSHIGSIGSVFFRTNRPTNYDEVKECDTSAFADYFDYLINHGIHQAPSQFEAMFLSTSHGDEEIGETLVVIEEYLKGFSDSCI